MRLYQACSCHQLQFVCPSRIAMQRGRRDGPTAVCSREVQQYPGGEAVLFWVCIWGCLFVVFFAISILWLIAFIPDYSKSDKISRGKENKLGTSFRKLQPSIKSPVYFFTCSYNSHCAWLTEIVSKYLELELSKW